MSHCAELSNKEKKKKVPFGADVLAHRSPLLCGRNSCFKWPSLHHLCCSEKAEPQIEKRVFCRKALGYIENIFFTF